MQKQVSFFERHVQWFAVGLGALFLGFMVYQYVLSSPVTVTAGGKAYKPGEIDEATLNGPITELERAIADPKIPEIPKFDYITQFLATIQGTNQQVPTLAETMFASNRMKGKIELNPKDEAIPGGPPVIALPKVPAAKPGRFNYGRSTVVYLDPAFVPDPKRPKKLPKTIKADIDWWSGSFTISSEQLAKSFRAAFDETKIEDAGLNPADFMQTAFIDVELVRQEMLPGGKPAGKEVVVKPLPISQRLPFPGAAAKEAVISEYLNWAFNSRNELLSPAFYEWEAGDEWESPIEEPKAQLVAADREAIRKASKARQAASAKQKQLDRKEKALRDKQAAAARRGSGGAGGGMPGGMRMPGGGGPAPSVPPPSYGGSGGMGQPPGPSSPYGGGGPSSPYGSGPGGMGSGPGGGGAPNSYAGNMPMPGGLRAGGAPGGAGSSAGRFEVIEGDDIQIIAHDDTVKAGKTYRYKLRYRLFNPVYKSFNAAPAALTKQFSIKSPDGGWTKPVTILAEVEFFLAAVRGEKASFDVFKWSEGETQKETIEAGPGDAIAGTGWSVVDVRGTGRRGYGLLMDSGGALDRRDPEGDSPGRRYQELLDEVEGPEVGMR